jgi:hypothetical protein
MRIALVLVSFLTLAACDRDLGLTIGDGSDGGMAGAAPDLATPWHSVPNTCGGFAGRPCPSDSFCELIGCEGGDLPGTCVPVPQACLQNYDPECGCDGTTYGNECERRAAMVALSYKGVCGCAQPCRAGTYCKACKLGFACLIDGDICD